MRTFGAIGARHPEATFWFEAPKKVMRYVGVAQFGGRVLAQDTTLADTTLKDGEIVYTLLAAANRDPSRWENPSHFDVRRPGQPHLGFGAGPHLCIGAHLARLETEVALEELLRIAPQYHLRDVVYGYSFLIRGPEAGVIDLEFHSSRRSGGRSRWGSTPPTAPRRPG